MEGKILSLIRECEDLKLQRMMAEKKEEDVEVELEKYKEKFENIEN
jgi:hypothetical protein